MHVASIHIYGASTHEADSATPSDRMFLEMMAGRMDLQRNVWWDPVVLVVKV
jgi:hypothetical protein